MKNALWARVCERAALEPEPHDFMKNNIVFPVLKKTFRFFKKIFRKVLTDLKIRAIILVQMFQNLSAQHFLRCGFLKKSSCKKEDAMRGE